MAEPGIFNKEFIARAYAAHFVRALSERPELGDRGMGWSFMYCPESRLRTARVGIIGLNPGADEASRELHAKQADWDWPDGGMAYLDQPWGPNGTLNALQQQIAVMVSALGLVSDDIFAAQFVPFRSSSWAELPDRAMAVDTCRPLWEHVLQRSPTIRLWISLGKDAGRELAKLTGAEAPPIRMRVGWGNQCAELFTASGAPAILALPHLSRFRIFTAKGAEEAFATLNRATIASGL